MESILSTNEAAKTYYDAHHHSYPDILCGSILKSDTDSKSGRTDRDNGLRCSVSDFWFTDPFCKSVVTNPEMK